MTTKKIGFVILPDEETSLDAIRLNRRYKGLMVHPEFVLAPDLRRPHITLIHLDMGEDNEWRRPAERVLIDLVDELHAGRFHSYRSVERLIGMLHQIEVINDGGWLFWMMRATESLKALHKAAVERLAPLRTKMETPPLTDPVAQDLQDRWGCSFVMERWVPHITLGIVNQSPMLAEKVRMWTAESLAIAEMGPFGEVMRVLYQVKF